MDRIKIFPIKLEHLWCLTILVGVFIFVNTHPIRPQDFWWHIRVGKEILETNSIPIVDKFSYTMFGQPYPSYQMFWLMEVFLYKIFILGGPSLIVFVQSIIITATYTIIVVLCHQVTGSWRIAAISGMISAALGLNDWNVRPQIITFLLGSICLWAIYTYRQKNKWMYLLSIPISMLIWVNSHGTFPIGLILIGIWFFDELVRFIKKRREGIFSKQIFFSAGTLLLSVIVLFVNPRGPGIISYLSTMGGNPIIQNLVVEWAPPTMNSLHGALFFSSLLLLAILMAITPRKPDMLEILTFLIFAILGINTSRGIIWFGLVTAPIFALHIRSIVSHVWSFEQSNGSTLMNGIISVCLIILAFITLPWFKDYLPLPPLKAGLISGETPIQATEFLVKEELPTQVFNHMSFGSYLIWAAQPDYKVFVDSRIELYPAKIWQDYLTISNAHDDWEDKLREYGVNTLMLNANEQAPLVMIVRESEQWTSVYTDQSAEIFIKKDVDD